MPSSWLEWLFFSCMQILSKYCKPYIKNFNMWAFFSPITITADLVPSETIVHLNSNCCLLSGIFAFILAASAAYLFHSNQIILLKNVQKNVSLFCLNSQGFTPQYSLCFLETRSSFFLCPWCTLVILTLTSSSDWFLLAIQGYLKGLSSEVSPGRLNLNSYLSLQSLFTILMCPI